MAQVASQIQEEIVHGRWPAGAPLPPQRDLAARFGISRASVREALSALSASGMIEVRPSQGVFVRALEGRATVPEKPDSWRFDGSLGLRDAYQIRWLIEPFSAGLVAPRISRDAVARLKENLAAMRSAMERDDLAEATRRDFDFHWLIAEQSGNQLFCDIIARCSAMMPARRSGRADFRTAEEHEQIVAGFAAGSARNAREAMARHIVAAAGRAGIAIPGAAGE